MGRQDFSDTKFLSEERSGIQAAAHLTLWWRSELGRLQDGQLGDYKNGSLGTGPFFSIKTVIRGKLSQDLASLGKHSWLGAK